LLETNAEMSLKKDWNVRRERSKVFTVVTTKNAVFCYIKSQFIPH
jgi:hypothetical protein